MRDVYFWFSLVGWAAAAVVLGWLLLTKMRKRQS
jgi:uncharacterized membrane protein